MNEKKNPEEIENIEVTELEDGDLEDVAGGAAPVEEEPNINCGNTQCCG